MTNAEIQVRMERPSHSVATEAQIPQNTEPSQMPQSEEYHLPRTSDETDSSSSHGNALNADVEDLDRHKIGIAVTCPDQDDNIEVE